MSKRQNLYDRAHQLHQSGRVQEAIELYGEMLRKQPRNPQILLGLGVAHFQTGQFKKSAELLQRFVLIDPKNAAAQYILGRSFSALNRPEDALLCFERALRLKPDYAEAFNNRGIVLTRLNRFEEALASYDQAVAVKPDYAEAHYNRGVVLWELKRLEDALACYSQALQIAPDYAEAYNNRGTALRELKRPEEALASYEQAVVVKPDYAEAHNNRGAVLCELRRLEEALASYEQAMAIKPDYAEAYNNRGAALRELERLEEALASYEQALSIKPDYAEAHNNRGVVLCELKRLEEALACYRQALQIAPDYAEAHNNRGIALMELERLKEALESYDQALSIKPDYAEAHYNLGVALQNLNQLDVALASYDRALSIKPDYAEAHWNKSLLLLLTGKFLEGWSLYEWRFKRIGRKKDYRTFPQPPWLGQADLQGKRLLIQSEQGLGDVVQFCRYLPQVKALGAEIILNVPESLVPLISTMQCPMTVVPRGVPLPEFDVYCNLMSLPHVFNTTIETIPARTPYLFSDQSKVQLWRKRLGNKHRPRVGLAWSGSEFHQNDRNRSIRLEKLLPLMGSSVEWHSLQKVYRQHDIPLLDQHPQIRRHQDELNDFADTAALIECMDLVMSVDTSVAHVAGAIGKPVWILLPCCPDFRWMLDRSDSPWYPTAKLYRQPKSEDWQSVVREVARALAEFINSDGPWCID